MDDPRPLHRLIRSVPQVGRVEWLGVSPAPRAEIVVVETARAEPGTGVVGDHHAAGGQGKRQITLVQAEHLPVISALLGGQVEVDPSYLRRNVVVSGINLWALRKLKFQLGGVLLEGTGPCPPCSRMEETLGVGGYHAVRGHGGITARVLTGGEVTLGARVRIATESESVHD